VGDQAVVAALDHFGQGIPSESLPPTGQRTGQIGREIPGNRTKPSVSVVLVLADEFAGVGARQASEIDNRHGRPQANHRQPRTVLCRKGGCTLDDPTVLFVPIYDTQNAQHGAAIPERQPARSIKLLVEVA
jgi:hypothetical protein